MEGGWVTLTFTADVFWNKSFYWRNRCLLGPAVQGPGNNATGAFIRQRVGVSAFLLLKSIFVTTLWNYLKMYFLEISLLVSFGKAWFPSRIFHSSLSRYSSVSLFDIHKLHNPCSIFYEQFTPRVFSCCGDVFLERSNFINLTNLK